MELQILTLVLEGIAGAAISYVGWKLKKIRETEEEIKRREKDFEELQLLSTKMILIRECNHYIEKGFAPVYAKSSITDIYQKYHALGGNGGIESLFREFKELLTTEATNLVLGNIAITLYTGKFPTSDLPMNIVTGLIGYIGRNLANEKKEGELK